ncbi:MAG: hypothetical protein ACM31C_04585 [Acidobacteriota bacterium]
MRGVIALVAFAAVLPARAFADDPHGRTRPHTVAAIARFDNHGLYIHTEDRVRLRELAERWRASPRPTLVVQANGWTAEDDTAVERGLRHADRVRYWLVRFGVDPARVVTASNLAERRGDYVTVTVDAPEATAWVPARRELADLGVSVASSLVDKTP